MEEAKIDLAVPERESLLGNNELSEPNNVTSTMPVLERLPVKKSVDIRFDNLAYTVSLGFRKGHKKILHEVSGRLPPSQLIAIMGPSGAGKSSLLDILSGYRITDVTGSVLVNGVQRDLDDFRRMSCYITQDDRLQPLLTVKENMHIAADLKLGEEVTNEDKTEIIETILKGLELVTSSDTRASLLSGGQKKRLSIALELIANPIVLFLDEPTTGLDSSSCKLCVNLLQTLAQQGRTIVCTIHQPSASIFQLFDQVYVLSQGECLYQGATDKLVPFLDSINIPCPKYHNPADFVIELACGEHGDDKIDTMVSGSENGGNIQWFSNPERLAYFKPKRAPRPNAPKLPQSLQATSQMNQLNVLLKRGFLKVKRDSTLTHMRILVNIITGIMLGSLFIHAGDEGSRVLDNYNLLFGILMHHMMTTMMLTILTFPMEMNILRKEHFNRWYSLKSYYISITLVDIPVSIIGCILFTLLVYFMSGQPADFRRLLMFFAISQLVVFVAQSFGLMIGSVFSVVNGTFLGPTLSVPVMMFAGFGVNLRDLPVYLKWGSYVSYLRYGLEGYIGAIYGLDRPVLQCKDALYCHYRYPETFLSEIAMQGDQFWIDVIALSVTVVLLRISAYILLRWRLNAVR